MPQRARGGSGLGFLGPEAEPEPLDETYKISSIVGWLTSNGQDGKVLVIPKGRLSN